VFILVQCNTSLSKNYVTRSVSVVCACDRLNLREKRFVYALWLSVPMKSVVEHEFFTHSHSTTKCSKHSANFESVDNIWSSNVVEFEFELRHSSTANVTERSKWVRGFCHRSNLTKWKPPRKQFRGVTSCKCRIDDRIMSAIADWTIEM